MEKYKAPKLKKLKKIKPSQVKKASTLESKDLKLITAGSKPKKKMMKKSSSKIPYYKSENMGKINIIDARAITDEEGKKMLERARMQYEQMLQKKSKKLK